MNDNDSRSPLGGDDQHKEGSRSSSSAGSQDVNQPKHFAENEANPAPQLAIHHDSFPEPVNAETIEPSGGSHWNIEPDLGDQRSTVVSSMPRNRKRKACAPSARAWFYIALSALLIAGGVGGAVAGVRLHSGAHTDSSISSSTSTRVSQSTQPSRATGTVSVPTGSSIPPLGPCQPSAYIDNINWMGIAGASGGWEVAYPAAADAAGCCTACYTNSAKGCDGWSFMPSASGSTIAACAVIAGWPGTKNDTTCPCGYTSVQFSQDGNNASHVGGAGPCAIIAK
ncbi:hypothetical protein BD289DRAFT_472690 [Coniella lustricola]|uniref:Uncharacterized protein n=1 Tax=Coniella lustricola TaxID=2025994 RepID=A0A2T3AEA5_9PEZI|nr:hypothetical protein BD289DRAFT_472690 [Coniella lustricola]